MKRSLLVLAVAVSLTSSILSAKEFSFDEGKISFQAPEEFAPLPQEIIDVKFPSARAPRWVVGTESATTTIAYDLKPHDIPQDKIDEAREAFAEMFPKIIPNLEWKANKTIEIDGRKWGYLEMTSSAIDTDIHNILLFTGYHGQMLVFNFNSTKEDFPKYESELRKSIGSIVIKDGAESKP